MENDKSTQLRATLARTPATPEEEATRLADSSAQQDQTAAARTLARDTAADPADEATRMHARGRPASHDDQTLAQAAVRPSSGKATQVNPDLASGKAHTQPSVFAHLDRKIAELYRGKKLLKERFVLLETLGSGGMGNVYLAKDLLREEMEDSNPHIAIKVLNDECRNLPGALQSLQREAKKAQALSHPNIVTVYDFDRDGETAFITMEYIDGDALKDHLRQNKRMPHDKAMYVIERVARGLAYAHQQGFAHADIKPANIFLGKNGAVKILDFGIAKAFTDATKEKRSLADDLTEGALTPGYASLEMLRGETALPADDVYSLACMAYEMIAGRHPFIGADGLPMPADVAQAKGAKLATINGVPRRHMRALRKGLEFERAKRYKDAGAFLDAVKKRNLKKDLALLSAAALVTGAAFFAANEALQRVVPSVSSLKPELASVASAIIEGDAFLQSADVDLAHRLYSQAWELANDLTANDISERNRAHAILRDRMNRIVDMLIERARAPGADEYQLRELYVALEFLHKDEISGNERKIARALDDLRQRLDMPTH